MQRIITFFLTFSSVCASATAIAQNTTAPWPNSLPPGGLRGVPSDRYRWENYREGYRDGFRDGFRDGRYRDGYRAPYPAPVYRGGHDNRGFGYPVNDIRAPYHTNPYPYPRR